MWQLSSYDLTESFPVESNQPTLLETSYGKPGQTFSPALYLGGNWMQRTPTLVLETRSEQREVLEEERTGRSAFLVISVEREHGEQWRRKTQRHWPGVTPTEHRGPEGVPGHEQFGQKCGNERRWTETHLWWDMWVLASSRQKPKASRPHSEAKEPQEHGRKIPGVSEGRGPTWSSFLKVYLCPLRMLFFTFQKQKWSSFVRIFEK